MQLYQKNSKTKKLWTKFLKIVKIANILMRDYRAIPLFKCFACITEFNL